jgi:hypothetical protein
MDKAAAANTGIAKVAVHCYADSFVIKENFSPHENYS